MMDLDNIPDTQTEAEELEEVVCWVCLVRCER